MLRYFRLVILLCLLQLYLVPSVYADEPVRVFVNEYQVIYDQLPIIEEGNTLVQFRPSFEALGFTVQWEQMSSTVTGTAPNLKVQMQMGSRKAYINGVEKELPAAPLLVNGSTFVPIRFLGEASGGDVTWDSATNHVDIVTDKSYYVYREAIANNLDKVRYWLEHGGGPNFANRNDGISSLGMASFHNNIEMVKLLLDYGAIPDIPNPVYAFAPDEMDMAIYGKNPELVRLLVQYGADPNKKTKQGQTLIEQVKQQLDEANSEDVPALNEILDILESAKDLPKINRYARFIAQDNSMKPTIANGERTWVDKQYSQLHPVLRNDLVMFEGPDGRQSMKRVIGLPGEAIRIDQENMYVNGERSTSNMLPGNKVDQAEMVLSSDQVFVIGDNYTDSIDSRSSYVGPVSLKQIIGKIIHIEHKYVPSEVEHPPQGTKQTNPAPATSAAKTYKVPPAMTIDTSKKYQAQVHTNKGDFTIEMFADMAPKTVNNFVFLSRQGFYNDVIFHRIIKSFMIQGGDPTGTGRGGPGYSFEDELKTSYTYEPGIVAMANAGPNTNGSQFFICTGEDSRNLAQFPNYTIFGKVTEGMETVLAIADVPVEQQDNYNENSKPAEKVVIQGIDIVESE
ncbi:signal peptidase I [Paenibacillus whitsoniae]|uniref:Signal peptidase I n=1 Tax=Paenibacillus whitsoniae TaxID=2496558 RepID=A0A3S0BLQ4_9BACL|nr:signal peptidase I [Paenibacillus whitsoniae]